MKHKIVSALCIRDEEWILPRTLDVLSVFSDKIIVLDDNGIISSLLKTLEPFGINATNPLSIPLVIQ